MNIFKYIFHSIVSQNIISPVQLTAWHCQMQHAVAREWYAELVLLPAATLRKLP